MRRGIPKLAEVKQIGKQLFYCKTLGWELGLKGTGSGKFKPPCPLSSPPPIAWS